MNTIKIKELINKSEDTRNLFEALRKNLRQRATTLLDRAQARKTSKLKDWYSTRAIECYDLLTKLNMLMKEVA